MNNVVKLDDYRRPSEAPTATEEKKVTIASNIYCDDCESSEMAITDLTENIMTVECVECGAFKRYITDQTPLL